VCNLSVFADVLYDQLKSKLPFLQCILKEVLRLYPPAWAINRSPKKDVSLHGHIIPKGTSIMINTLRLHRRGQYFKRLDGWACLMSLLFAFIFIADLGWERPLEFIPERWEHEEGHYSKSAFVYVSFGPPHNDTSMPSKFR
jgi:cytochrome P450